MERLKGELIGFKLIDEDERKGTFSGYGAYFGNEDSYGDVISRGAFTKTLRDWKARNKFPPMLLQHGGFGIDPDGLLPVGRWTSMVEDSKGLKVEGELFGLDTERGTYIFEGLKSGALDGLSIGFRVRKYTAGTKAGEPRRTIEELDLWELSIVTFPANDRARITGVKDLTPEEIRGYEDALQRAGFPRKDRRNAVNILKEYQISLQQCAEGPEKAVRKVKASGDEQRLSEALDRLNAKYIGASLKQ